VGKMVEEKLLVQPDVVANEDDNNEEVRVQLSYKIEN